MTEKFLHGSDVAVRGVVGRRAEGHSAIMAGRIDPYPLAHRCPGTAGGPVMQGHEPLVVLPAVDHAGQEHLVDTIMHGDLALLIALASDGKHHVVSVKVGWTDRQSLAAAQTQQTTQSTKSLVLWLACSLDHLEDTLDSLRQWMGDSLGSLRRLVVTKEVRNP